MHPGQVKDVPATGSMEAESSLQAELGVPKGHKWLLNFITPK